MSTPTPPAAEKKPQQLTTHGTTRTDPYFWLRERDNPAVRDYLEAENAYTQAVMAHTEGLQETLYEELVGRIQETDHSVPVRIDDFFYYTRTEAGRQYPIYCRKAGSLEADEEVLLDPNALAADHDYLNVGVYKVSPDHRRLAYSLDTSGSERYTLFFKSLETGELLPDQIENTFYSLEWSADSETVYYTTPDDAWRSYRVYRHTLGQPADQDSLLYEEEDALFSVHVAKTHDKQYLTLTCHAIETTEVYLLEADDHQNAFRVVAPREKGVRYAVEHRNGTLYIVTNAGGATNNKIVTTLVGTPDRDQWETYIPHRKHIKIDDIELFAQHLVIYERENGLRTVHVVDLRDQSDYTIEFDEPVYTYAVGDNPNFDSNILRLEYTSLATPKTTYDYNLDLRERVLKKREPILGGFESENYVTDRIFAVAEDGAEVPVSLVHRRDVERDPDTPCLLYGYGAYGFSMDPAFRRNWISLVDRGFVVAIGHIRGGQEMGREWYEAGKFLNKRNTFTDFIACARHLVDAGYTRPEKLAIMGGSAGGLLIGAVLNMAPDLFATAVAHVPFVDVVTTMLDDSIPLTVGEYDEWGNPNDPTYFEYMLSYSPYDNVEAREYPHLLITCGLNDPRVQYWEPAKWTARLRATKTGDQRLLLKTNMGAGHGGASGRYDYLKEVALDYAFILDTLGLYEPDADA